MSRSSTAQRTGPYRLPLLSASQEKQTECWRRWGFARLEGLKEPQGDAAMRGTAHHAEMEAWSLFGKLPTSKPALAALKYAPPRGVAEIEIPVRFDTPNSPWVGYIDAAFDWHNAHDGVDKEGNLDRFGLCKPIGSTGWTVIQDYKFTGSLRNAKTGAELLCDAAANLYAYEAFLGGAERVSGRWVYVQMNGSASTKVVWFDFDRANVERIISELDEKAWKIQRYYDMHRAGALNVLDLPTNTAQCYAYRQQCPHMALCNPDIQISMTGAAPMQDFKDAITAGFPGSAPAAPKLPPKLPPKLHAVPALPKKPIDIAWEQITKDLTAPESGFVNPPEAPKVAALSPEHAAELQGITTPVSEERLLAEAVERVGGQEEFDELESYSRDQLKALAVTLGAVPENSRAREPALKEAIRRARAGTLSDGTLVQENAVEAAVQSISSGAPKAPPKLPPKKPTETEDPDRWKGIDELLPADEEIGRPAREVLEELLGKPRLTLYVNCAPLQGSYDLDMRDVMAEAGKLIKEHHGVDDYRLVEYGKGAGALCIAIKMMHEREFFGRNTRLVIDSRTPEGNVLLETLSGLASEIVRGF